VLDEVAQAWSERPVDPATGAFRVGPLRPGRELIKLADPDFPLLVIGVRELGPTQEADLGVRQFRPGGRIAVHVVGTDGRTPAKINLRIRERGGDDVYAPALVGGDHESEVIPVGEYELTVWGHDLPIVCRNVVVRAGEVTDARIEVPAAVRCVFDVEGVDDDALGGVLGSRRFVLLHADWEDAAGRELANDDLMFDKGDAVRIVRRLLPGRYTLRLSGPGYSAEATFDVAAGAGAAAPAIQLRLAKD